MVETFKPGEQVILKRDETWNRGSANKPAFFKRVIIQSVPEPATRANLVERGDADLVVDLQASDVQSLEAKGKLKVVSTPQYNAITYRLDEQPDAALRQRQCPPRHRLRAAL